MVVLPCTYAPSVAYMSMLMDSSTLIEAHEYYQKQTYRNRCAIIGAEGIMRLSIPILAGSSQHCPIQAVQIANHDNWRHKHWHTIETCYGSSPYYEYYAPDLAPLYLDKHNEVSSLYQYNQQLIIRICELLHLPYQWQETQSYIGAIPHYELLSSESSIGHPISMDPYYQIFFGAHGFVSNLSIFDLLFNMGPESLIILHQHYAQISAHLATK